MTDEDRVLLEDMNGKLDALLEGQEAMGHVPAQAREIDLRLGKVESELKGLKVAVRDQFRDYNNRHKNLDRRVTRLEQGRA